MIRRMHSSNPDQTRFAAEEPMFENMVGLPPDENPQVIEPQKPFFKRKGVIIGLIAGTTVIVLLTLFIINLIILKNRTPQAVYPTGTDTTTDPNQNNPLIKRLTVLKSELRSADPNQVKYVFPSVNLQLEIDSSN